MQAKGGMTLLGVAMMAALVAPALADTAPGVVQLEGVITAVDLPTSTFTMQITGNGSGSSTVLVQRATELRLPVYATEEHENSKGEVHVAHRPSTPTSIQASIADFHVGDRVNIEGFRLDSGRILALRADVLNRAITPQPSAVPLQRLVTQGVVASRTPSSLTVVEPNGATRLVLVTPETHITGQRSSLAAIGVNDIVRADGVLNGDGSVTSQQVEVVFANGYQVAGRITFKSTTVPQYLVLDNRLLVNLASDTLVLSGNQARSIDDLRIGQAVTVVGTPINVGRFVVGVNARVIVF